MVRIKTAGITDPSWFRQRFRPLVSERPGKLTNRIERLRGSGAQVHDMLKLRGAALDISQSPVERGENNLKYCKDFRTEHGSNRGQNLALTVFPPFFFFLSL